MVPVRRHGIAATNRGVGDDLRAETAPTVPALRLREGKAIRPYGSSDAT